MYPDGGVEGLALIFPCKNSKITTCCWTMVDRIMLDTTQKKIPHIQGQRNRPSKMVGGVNSHLESNPVPARGAQRAQTNLVHTRTQGPHRDWDRTMFEHLWWRYGSAVDCHRGKALGTADLGMAWALLEEVTINPTIELPELTQDWEIDCWRAQTELCLHQDPGERSSDPTRDWPRLTRECPGVSSRVVGQWWPAAGLGALSVAVPAWDLLKEVVIIFITSTIVWPSVK